MALLILALAVLLAAIFAFRHIKRKKREAADLSMLPERFVIFDLETTGLDPLKHEIIEIGAIRVDRDADALDTFSALTTPKGRLSAKIAALTGITPDMLARDGRPLGEALAQFRDFVGDSPLIAFNADFDREFLRAACKRAKIPVFQNPFWCALKMARRAWPNRRSYKLVDLARDGGLADRQTHRALDDCQITMKVYVAAAQTLKTHR